MRAFPLLIATCGLALACDSAIQEPHIKTPSEPRGFALFGLVRDESGVAVPGATVLITFGSGRDQTATTNENGIFIFAGLQGLSTLRVTKFGYHSTSQTVVVTADQAVEFRLAKAEVIELGRVIGAVTDEPPCDPIGWDERAPCRRFRFTPPSSGLLVIVVTWRGGSEMDATILTPTEWYLASSVESGFKEITLQTPVEGGVTYEVRVNSYYENEAFDLKADLVLTDFR
jgi:hypothetical protein